MTGIGCSIKFHTADFKALLKVVEDHWISTRIQRIPNLASTAMRISESKFNVTEEVKYAAKLRAEAEARRVIQEAEAVHRAREAAKAKAKAEIRSLASAARAAAKAKAEAAAIEEARIDATGKDEWFYLQSDEPFGPVKLEDLRAMIADPELESPIKMVWAEGMEMWRPVYEVRRVCDPDGNYNFSALAGEVSDDLEEETDEVVVVEESQVAPDETAAQPAEWEANLEPQMYQELLEARRRLKDQQKFIERAEAEARLRATAEARVEEEARLRVNAEARAAELERLRSLAEAKAADETRTLAEALAKALEEAKLREAAEARASEAQRMQEVAEAKVRAEELRRAAAEARAAEEKRTAAAARAYAEEESRAKALVEAKVAAEAREAARARARAEEEAKLRLAAEANAAEQTKHAAAANQRADQEARGKAQSDARAAEEARSAAREKARAEEESKMRRAAEARASEEARQAAMAKARAENEAKAKADLEARAVRDAEQALIDKIRAKEETRQAVQATIELQVKVPVEADPGEQAPAQVMSETGSEKCASNISSPVSKISSDTIDSEKPDEDAMYDAEINALAAQEERLQTLAKERAEKEAKARSEFKSRASQATRAAIAAKRKVRRQVLARAMESARMRALEEAASALMEAPRPEDGEVVIEFAEPETVVPAGVESQALPKEIKVEFVIEAPAALESAAVAESEMSSEPVAAVDPELCETPSESVVAKSPPKRRHSILSGKRVWHYTCEGERVGPVSFQELKELASAATLDPRRDLVWKKGSPDWQPAGKVDGLFPRRSEEVEATVKTRPAASNDELPRTKSRVAPWRYASLPGARRRSLWFFALVFPFVWEFALKISQPHLTKQFGEIMVGRFLPAATLMPLLLLLLIGWKRLTNLGMSRWWCLAAFAPPVNLWIGYRCFACPSGYAHHRKLDVSGMVLAVVYWMVLIWTVWNLLGSHPQWYGWIENSDLKTQISHAIEYSGIAGGLR